MVRNKSDAPKDKRHTNKEQNMKEKPFEIKNELPISLIVISPPLCKFT